MSFYLSGQFNENVIYCDIVLLAKYIVPWEQCIVAAHCRHISLNDSARQASVLCSRQNISTSELYVSLQFLLFIYGSWTLGQQLY